MSRRPRPLLLALVVLLMSACQVRMATDIAVERDGSGTFEFAVSIDEELARDLREAGVDPLEGLEEVQDGPWELVRDDPSEGGVGVRLRADFEDSEQLGDLADDLHAELDRDDVRVHDGLQLERREDGSMALSGRVGLRLPAAPGAEGAGVTFDADDLRRLLEERGEEFVRYDVRVTLPTAPVEHDADEVDGNSLVWRAPVTAMRDVSAVSAAPGTSPVLIAVAVGLVAAVVTGLAVFVWRRRRSVSSGE